MICGFTHLSIPVADIEEAVHFYVSVLGCDCIAIEAEQAEIVSGFFGLFLKKQELMTSSVEIWFEADHLEKVTDKLPLKHTKSLQEPTRDAQRLMLKIADPSGNTIVLWRKLTEDDREELPVLPTTIPWIKEAEVLAQILLKSVPVAFRKSARVATVCEAEYLAGGANSVAIEQAVLGIIRSAPVIMREILKEPLAHQGINWEDYASEFEVPSVLRSSANQTRK